MEDPSPQVQPRVEESGFAFDHNEPSSPFVSEANSRLMSKQWDAPITKTEEEQHTMDIFATPMKHGLDDMAEDKENVPETGGTITKLRPATPPESKALPDSPVNEARRESTDSDLMPPPQSTRKSQTPKRSPLKPSRDATGNAQTPRATTSPRKNSFGSELTQSTPRGSNNTSDTRSTHQYAEESSGFDDTCFSAFSEVPDMTTWAKMGQSPTKRGEALRTPGRQTDATPRTSRKRSSPSRSPSPTPRRSRVGSKSGHGHSSSQDGTTFLIDFTQQMDNMASYSRHASPAKSSTQPDLLKFMNSQRSPHKTTRQSYATPAKQSSIMNLLDFELPPAPTPRSVPTITVRELESLKSSYLSQISSLKATLSGREAEVESLKRAVGDAERRVGEAQERLREEKNRREDAEEQKAGWEKRGQEVEYLLKDVKEEVMKSEAEKEELARKVEEYERRIEDSEARAVKAEERYADALAARAAAGEGGEIDPSAVEERVQRLVSAQIDSKIEAVSRELHAVYKEKHERKVATLKKSYEARGEKKCAELQARLHQLEKQNEDLLAAKDATFSGPVAGDMTFSGEAEAELKAQIEEQRAQFARLEAEMLTSRQHQEQLERELAQERIEKGDLVAAVDEMLLLQSEQGPAQGAMSVVEDFRKSISRPASAMSSGLRAPGSKIGGVGRPASGIAKGGMMSRIEKMGSSRTGGGHD
ncbi:hypothetical protein CBER1_02535 [Cercospora berteroae]|uniref:Uncharacterized protein n=1 Tax=Cercospora berteroae TaxID=357750 RepID=A0A2S6C486_9PEZI|nr:hypothetical protein CBER1_02535 [Cercospora berteroae]